MKAKSILLYMLPIAFLAILYLPLINGGLNIWQFERKNENRVYRDSVEVDLNHLDAFPNDFDTYFADNISFRTPLLDAFHNIKFSYFKISPHPDRMFVGYDNWCFLSTDEKKIYSGELDFSLNDLEKLKIEWTRRKHFLDSLKIPFYWLISPCKHNVYDNKIPFNILKSDTSRTRKIIQHLKPVLNDQIIDPTQTFIENRENTDLFYRLDNHWNYEGGHLASKILHDRINQDFGSHTAQFPEITWKDSVRTIGIHLSLIGIDGLGDPFKYPLIQNETATEAPKFNFPPTPGFAYPWEYEFRFIKKEPIKNGLRVLFIRDSFSGQMMPFTKEMFNETLYIFDAWQYLLNEDIILKYKPDLVVFQGLETHIKAIIKDK
ncbi:MAG: hypothetical protein CMP61_10005 [Flavobacteriales bacterium]|nr:hypothetical protein [Flavobacteriales bacterium]|tara:strand:- start:26729 stop:27856 length:1128 start_codon:yes stop_codon:yes gene_type:complete